MVRRNQAGHGDVLGESRENLKDPPRPILYKLIRGVFNLGLGAYEIPFGIVNEGITASTEYRNPLVGMVVGGIMGLGFTLARVGTGTFEVVTFPVSFNFEPIMDPETPLLLEYGDD